MALIKTAQMHTQRGRHLLGKRRREVVQVLARRAFFQKQWGRKLSIPNFDQSPNVAR